jgi:hypothetical protein
MTEWLIRERVDVCFLLARLFGFEAVSENQITGLRLAFEAADE